MRVVYPKKTFNVVQIDLQVQLRTLDYISYDLAMKVEKKLIMKISN